MIAIIEYDAGNLRSVGKALEFIDADVSITAKPKEILNANGVILPGVGAFADCMGSLRSNGLDEVVKEVIHNGTPFLGICLGYQMLFDYSEENAGNGNIVEGMGIFKGAVRQIPDNMGLKVPHMGWNNLIIQKESSLFHNLAEDPFVYFVHSYYVDSEDKTIVSAKSRYGILFDVAIHSGNVFGTQFHPEKSGDVGLGMLKNFMKVVNER